MAGAVGVAFGDKVGDVLVRGRERQVLAQHGLDVRGRNHVAISFVKQFEALFRLGVLLGRPTVAFEPVRSDHVDAEIKGHSIAFEELRVGLLKRVFNVTGTHFVEPKVLENVSEEGV